MTEKEIFELFDLYGTDMGDYYEIEVGRIERLVKEIEFQSAPKELSDEEIEQIASQYLTAHAQFIGAGEVCYEGEIEFARAILKKASEK